MTIRLLRKSLDVDRGCIEGWTYGFRRGYPNIKGYEELWSFAIKSHLQQKLYL